MSLVSSFKNNYKFNGVTFFRMGCFGVTSGIAHLIVTVGVNDLICLNRYTKLVSKPSSLKINFMEAKYTRHFLTLSIIYGFVFGAIYGYREKPLLFLLFSN